ncbi:hypothetical protein CCR75_001262 [Bremia lactucae]|uniref:Uncharacterized protein n=2 Tax=Bremia lactucae TaxID=4779 RepID=A0A976NYC1_BRELC|nr:hypothetical protein CCR75_001262 [Bremia lactucae]
MTRESQDEDAEMMQQEEPEEQRDDMDDFQGEDDDDASGSKRRLFRFKPAYDVLLVREVIRDFPWAAGYGRTRSAWMAVATRVQTVLESNKGVIFSRGSTLDHAIVKRRVDMLLEAYRKNELSTLRGSGTPEEFDMRYKLIAILTRVVDEQTLNKGAMREKRVQSALQDALRSLEELDVSANLAGSQPIGFTSSAAAPLSSSLMPIAPAPASTSTVTSRASPSLSPSSQSPTIKQQAQQNDAKRPLRTSSMPVAALIQDTKRSRVERTGDTISNYEERKLRLQERRVALEEERLYWDKQKAEQEGKERQALLDLLRAQGSLLTELVRTTKESPNTLDL